ncbi:MAG: hypothetical protein NC320_03095 [Clostridium sp.]|nr:hypothetical protein [Clostridium sp.]
MKIYIKGNNEINPVLQAVKEFLKSAGYKENKSKPGAYLIDNWYQLCININQIDRSGSYWDVGLFVYDGCDYVGGITLIDLDLSGDFGSVYAFIYNEPKENMFRMYNDIYEDENFGNIYDAINYVISGYES